MRTLVLAAFSAILLTSCADETKKPEGNLELSGNVAGLKSGTIFIQKLKDSTLVTLDSIAISGDSHFQTYLKIESPEMLYMYLDRGATNSIDNSLMFFAEPGKINIETTLETFYADAKITGSANDSLYREYLKVKSRFTDQELELTEARLKAFQNKEQAPQDGQKADAITKRKYLHAINFAVNNKNHEVAPYIALTEIADANLKFLDTIHKSLSPKVAKSKYGELLKKYIAERKKLEQ